MRASIPLLLTALVLGGVVSIGAQDQGNFRFKSGVDLVNVTATVTNEDGRFVPGLRREDFSVYEDGRLQEVSHFSSDRVPVSLGLILDASGSMTPDKMSAARAAIDRLIYELLDKDDELFFVEFATHAKMTQGWTKDRQLISRAVKAVDASGGTAIYDAVAMAIPTAQAGTNRKKALLVISDGNDTNSTISASELRQRIRESEVLVYALGIDSTRSRTFEPDRPPVQLPLPIPLPFPGGRRPQRFPPIGGGGGGIGGGSTSRSPGDRVNADALRFITDDTGGRTEIVRGSSGLGPATERIADELSKQYYLGYVSSAERDGRWHSIRVEVRDRRLTVRARRGYTAS
ncbi:MAG TPA: VWA domain-containing protein [Vicinamibacterales bacterium]|jgi:VWFA-related protein